MKCYQWCACTSTIVLSITIGVATGECQNQNVNAHILSRGYAQTPFTERSNEFNADARSTTTAEDRAKVDSSKRVNMYSHQLYNSKRNKKNRTLVGGDQAIDRFAKPLQDQVPTVVGQVK